MSEKPKWSFLKASVRTVTETIVQEPLLKGLGLCLLFNQVPAKKRDTSVAQSFPGDSRGAQTETPP